MTDYSTIIYPFLIFKGRISGMVWQVWCFRVSVAQIHDILHHRVLSFEIKGFFNKRRRGRLCRRPYSNRTPGVCSRVPSLAHAANRLATNSSSFLPHKLSIWIISPRIGVQIKHDWNHHLIQYHIPTAQLNKPNLSAFCCKFHVQILWQVYQSYFPFKTNSTGETRTQHMKHTWD